MLQAAIYVFAIADFDDEDFYFSVENFVNDPVIAGTQAVDVFFQLL